MKTLKRWTPPEHRKEREAPKQYNTSSTVMQLLDDLNDDDSYSTTSLSAVSSNEVKRPLPARRQRLLHLANYFFFLATIFYLIGAILNLKDVDGGLIATSVGALLFVVTGTLEYYTEPVCFNLFLISAGIFGFAGEILDSADRNASGHLLNSVSVHLFLLESFKLVYQHWCSSQPSLTYCYVGINWILCLSDVFFFGGSLMDTCLSYVYLAIKIESGVVNQAEVVGATFWVFSSLLAILFWYKETSPSLVRDDNGLHSVGPTGIIV